MRNKNRKTFSTDKNLSRKRGTLEPKKLFLIACEGICTEPLYFKGIVNFYASKNLIARGSLVIARHKHSDPKGVLEDLQNFNDWQRFDEKWIVIDRDEVIQNKNGAGGHSQENFCSVFDSIALLEKAKYGEPVTGQYISQNGKTEHSPLINVAWTNPCFEFWLLLHFVYRITGATRTEVQKLLLAYLKKEKILGNNAGIEELKNMGSMFVALEPKMEFALANAQTLLKSNSGKKIADCNPGTTVHLLVMKFLEEVEKQKAAHAKP